MEIVNQVMQRMSEIESEANPLREKLKILDSEKRKLATVAGLLGGKKTERSTSKWTPEMIARAHSEIKKGRFYSEIAAELGVELGSLQSIAYRHKIGKYNSK